MKHTSAGLAVLFFFLGMARAGGTSAATVWYQPTGLSPGDEYQLVFVTSKSTGATSHDLSYYETFVNDVAANDTELAEINWHPIVSTNSSDARDTAMVHGPVYNLDDNLVAHSFSDWWRAFHWAPIHITEKGDPLLYPVWTGTDTDGTAASFPVGGGSATFGYSGSILTTWINQGAADAVFSYPLYALSDPITVVPLPGAVWLLGSGLSFVFLFRRKTKRQ